MCNAKKSAVWIFKGNNNVENKLIVHAIPVSITSPSRSVMKELIWLIRNGIVNIISFVDPFCFISPSTFYP